MIPTARIRAMRLDVFMVPLFESVSLRDDPPFTCRAFLYLSTNDGRFQFHFKRMDAANVPSGLMNSYSVASIR